MLLYNPVENVQEIGGLAYKVRGFNPDIDQAVEETIWPLSGRRPVPSSAVPMEIVSSSSNDDSGGSGAEVVLVQGLGAQFEIMEESVPMNGTTPMILPDTFFRILRLTVTQSGAGGSADGDITVQEVGGGTVWDVIEAGSSVSRSGVFTVPKGHYAYLTDALFSDDSNGTSSVRILVKAPGQNVVRSTDSTIIIEGFNFLIDSAPERFYEGTDLEFVALGSAPNLVISVTATLRLKNIN